MEKTESQKRQEQGAYQRWILLAFSIMAVIAAAVLVKALAGLWVVADLNDRQLVGSQLTLTRALALAIVAGGAIFAYRHPRVAQISTEVAKELSDVTWPDRKELVKSTQVVVVMVVIVSAVLGVFDFVFSFLTRQVY
jgi:preprotein translocase subunit SecE